MTSRQPVILSIALAFLALIAISGGANAGRYGDDYVTAVSRFGNGTVSGPVRYTSTGREVRLPGGTWVGCRRSCSETLRVQTVDFWEKDGSISGAGTFANQCGVFGCLDIHFPR